MTIGRAAPQAGPRKGDIFVVAVPALGGHVQAGRRPAVVVQADRFSRSGTVVLCPITSAPPPDDHPRPHRVLITPAETGLDRAGWVKADQLQTIPTGMLQGPVARLAPAAINRLDVALRFVLDL